MTRYAALAWFVLLPLAAEAQTSPPCTYDRCALRIEDANPEFPARVVQGVEGRPVGSFGLFSPSISLLAAGPDSVRIPYEQFRSRQRTMTVLGVLSVASLAAVPFFVHMSSRGQIGRASCRERVEISVVGGSFKKKGGDRVGW